MEVNTRPGPPSPPAAGDDWPYGDGIPNNEVEADMRAIEQAESFWATYADSDTRNEKYKVRFRDALAKHIARLEELWENVASYNADIFSHTSRKSTTDAKLRNPELVILWEQLITTQEAQDDEVDISDPLHKLEQKLRRIALTGIHVGNLTKKHTKTEKAAGGPDIRKPVYAS